MTTSKFKFIIDLSETHSIEFVYKAGSHVLCYDSCTLDCVMNEECNELFKNKLPYLNDMEYDLFKKLYPEFFI